MSSLILKPSPFRVERSAVRGLPSLARTSSSFRVEASGVKKKIKTDKPYGIGGGMKLDGGLDASGRKGKGKGVYQFVDKMDTVQSTVLMNGPQAVMCMLVVLQDC